MKKILLFGSLSLFMISILGCSHKDVGTVTQGGNNNSNSSSSGTDSSIVNFSHLNNLCVNATFPDGVTATAVYIYSDAPNYVNTDASGEGYSCVDDVSRAALAYLRSAQFATDTAVRNRVYGLLNFVLEMQSPNGYFYNFLQTGNQINTSGSTSVNTPNWWSWRALQALTEAEPIVQTYNTSLANKINNAVNSLVSSLKSDEVNIAETTTTDSGIIIPQWLPGGSAADQSATLILGLIPYAQSSGDTAIKSYIKKLADGIVLMQQGDSAQIPYGCFLSSGNNWNAYGCDQAYALLKAGLFLNNASYTNNALIEVNYFFTWLLSSGMMASFDVINQNGSLSLSNKNNYPQIAYDIRPMVFAAIEAYSETGAEQYADIAGHLAAWFLGNNVAGVDMYSSATGITFDGISAYNSVNENSGAESTIEAILTLERVEAYPSVLAALNKYKR